jgi:hypothetical protein
MIQNLPERFLCEWAGAKKKSRLKAKEAGQQTGQPQMIAEKFSLADNALSHF